MHTLIRKTFLFLVSCAHRSRVAAYAAALMALFFARYLTVPAERKTSRKTGRTFDGEYRRLDR